MVSLAPRNATSPAGTTQLFIATYRNNTGNGNLTECRLRVGTTNNNALYVWYNPVTNKLYLRPNLGIPLWVPSGGVTPGSNTPIANSQGTLDCQNTQVIKSGTDIIVIWALKPSATFTGTHPVFMLCKNNVSQITALEAKGTWTITP